MIERYDSADTICAVATSPGSVIGIIRISGPKVSRLYREILNKNPQHLRAIIQTIYDAKKRPIDRTVNLFYRAPHSYTGEDQWEIFCHGGRIIIEKLIELLRSKGVRLARAGEFTKRAVLNGKMSLLEAESVQSLVLAEDEEFLKVASSIHFGMFESWLKDIIDKLIDIKTAIEYICDFPDEDDMPENTERICTLFDIIIKKLNNSLIGSKSFLETKKERMIALIGRPNAGKSSIMNALLGYERVGVSNQPGTTRDFVKEVFVVGKKRVELVDTAGISDDKKWQRFTQKILDSCDRIVLVVDASKGLDKEDKAILRRYNNKLLCLVFNKKDLLKKRADVELLKKEFDIYKKRILILSAKTKEGISELKEVIEKDLRSVEFNDNIFITCIHRHIECLELAIKELKMAYSFFKDDIFETSSEHLNSTIKLLKEIIGEDVSEDYLDRIFKRFCVGK